MTNRRRPEKRRLVFGIVVGFYLFDLVGVPLGVGGDEKDKFVSVHLVPTELSAA